MLELKITALLHSSAEKDIIGIKESIAYLVEKWADVLSIDVKAAEPLQITFGEKSNIRQSVTVQSAIAEIKKHNLTIEEMQNIVAALIELSKIENKEECANAVS